MNTKDYLREGYRQVLDQNLYTRIGSDPTTEVSERITEKLIQMRSKGLIADKNFEYLKPKDCKHGQFYLLPKIHKKGIPGRPICSSVNHPTANISKFVDEHGHGHNFLFETFWHYKQQFITKIITPSVIQEFIFIYQLASV